MPIYEYRCSSCGHQFELLQSFSAAKTAACPECGSAAQRLLSTGAGIILKGAESSPPIRGQGQRSECDRLSPCCGAETRCDKPPCEN